MPKTLPLRTDQEQQLLNRFWSPEFAEDPERFVAFAFPWGEANTPLAHISGPRRWQLEILREIRDQVVKNVNRMQLGLPPEVYEASTVSGRGIGKSTLFSWLTLWSLSCHPGSTVIVTANTEEQLKTRTWGEMGKWHTLALNSHWFDRSTLALKPAQWYEAMLKDQLKIDTGYYYAVAQLWSEEKPDSFAGAHNPKGMMVLFDEASGIPAPIYKVTEGFFTEEVVHRYWLQFGNGRRASGPFFESHHRERDRWRCRQIDSRTVEGIDPSFAAKVAATYGEDSNEFRVEVQGQFPKQGDRQFISHAVVEAAQLRPLVPDPAAPLIIGVDPARYGDDKSVIRFRRGRDARSIAPRRFSGLDNVQLAFEVAKAIDLHDPDAVCIDAGNGTGVIDLLRHQGYVVHEVWFGAKAHAEEWANRRTELWALVREWLPGACIDLDSLLKDDLTGPEYRFQKATDKVILESKEELKSRGIHSPDDADALACTFAVRVAPRGLTSARRNPGRSRRIARGVDYNPLGR